MRAQLTIDDQVTVVDLSAPVSLAWPLAFAEGAPNPDAFSLPRPSAVPVEAGTWVGDVARGGSVNCYVMSLCTHGAGTHTECRGHITAGGGSVTDAMPGGLLPATLITVEPALRADVPDAVPGESADTDLVIGRAQLDAVALLSAKSEHHRAVVVRATAHAVPPSYSGTNPAYFTPAAVDFLRGLGCRHLLTDLPSIDREHDGGTTPSHRAFFAGDEPRTITEMAHVPASVGDGRYLLDLQLPPFVFESAPSRPLLFRAVTEEPT